MRKRLGDVPFLLILIWWNLARITDAENLIASHGRSNYVIILGESCSQPERFAPVIHVTDDVRLEIGDARARRSGVKE